MVSFTAIPQRDVAAPDGTRWHIAIRPGWSWRGWRWTARLQDSNLAGSGTEGDLLVLVLLGIVAVVEAPVRVARWASYVARRRRDWTVMVRRSGSSGDWDVVLVESHPTRQAAADRASQVIADVRAGRLVGDGPDGVDDAGSTPRRD